MVVEQQHPSDPAERTKAYQQLEPVWHDNILRLYDWFQDREGDVYVFEYAGGRTLLDHLATLYALSCWVLVRMRRLMKVIPAPSMPSVVTPV